MAIGKQQINGSSATLYTNVTCDQIQIAEDKLRLKLATHLSVAKKSRDWITYLSVFLTAFSPLLTAEFKKWWIFEASQIELFFKIVSVLCVVMFFKSLVSAISGTSVDKIVDDFKSKE